MTNDVKTCSCGCSYFEQVKVSQFKKNHNISYHSEIPTETQAYYVLRCMKCNEITLPDVIRNFTNDEYKAYDKFLDDIGK